MQTTACISTSVLRLGPVHLMFLAIMNMGELTPFTCPACHGTLVRLTEGNILRFRCHTGHAYTASALLDELSQFVEDILWQAVRVTEEKAMLEKNIAGHLSKINQSDAAIFKARAEKSLESAHTLHDLVFKDYSPRAES